jgi:hypothetical protein
MWRYRLEDVKRVLDHLDAVEAAVPGPAGRIERQRIWRTLQAITGPGRSLGPAAAARHPLC